MSVWASNQLLVAMALLAACALGLAGCGGAAADATTHLIATTTILSASPAKASVGSTITLSASVTYAPAETASGTVNFLDGMTSLGAASLDAKGIATLTVKTLAAGTHTITATFPGDSMLAASASAGVSVTITP